MSVSSLETNDLLKVSRRLDWRFLLSDPQLNRVAFYGTPESSLLAALKLFSQEVVSLPHSDIGEKFNLLVMENPSTEIFKNSMTFLQSNGAFYIEFTPNPKRILWLDIMKRQAHRQGFENLRFHWHWSNFESPERIIPLARETPLLYDLAKRGYNLRTRIKLVGAKLSLKSGLLPYLLPSLSMIGERR